MDPLVVDFMEATKGHSPIVNFSTTPAWMWKAPEPVTVPSDPDAVDFGYMRGTDLAVPVSRVGDYYRRLVAWYTHGGFIDELRTRHRSSHRMAIDYWEVLNEIDAEHTLSPQMYVQLYDTIVSAVRSVSPRTEFIGLALSTSTLRRADYVRYFLSPHNHAPGVPLDWISYHFYAIPSAEAVSRWGATSFSQADAFLAAVDRIEAIRARLSPHTRTAVNEAGTLLRDAATQADPAPIPSAYWNYSAAVYAYLCANLALRGIDLVAQSQLVGYPGQFPSVTMLDWQTGLPNARYRALGLLLRHLRPGDQLCQSHSSAPSVHGLGSCSPDGERRVLLVNKTYRSLEVRLTGLRGATIDVVDERSGGGPPRRVPRLPYDALRLPGYGVAIARLITRSPRRLPLLPRRGTEWRPWRGR